MALPRSLGGLLLPRCSALLQQPASTSASGLLQRAVISRGFASESDEEPISIEARSIPCHSRAESESQRFRLTCTL